MIYLDANATEPLRPAARAAALAALGCGNPSSIHQAGRAARAVLETARERIAQVLRARPQDVVFTSGATEANALAIHASGRRIVIGATEHDAIRVAAPGAAVIPVDREGLADVAVLEALLAAGEPALVCLMAANNETGVRQDIAQAAAICARHGALLHVDAVQAAGRCRDDWLGMGAASLAISGHKFGGLMGAGALVMAPGAADRLTPLLRGGGQERNRRGGTPALPAIAAMAAALIEPYDAARITGARDEIAAFCMGLGAVVAGAGAPRLPNTICMAFPGIRAETQVIALDMAGFAVSAGAACSSGKVAASHVLLAMGYGAAAGQAIRVSLPWNLADDAAARFTQAYAIMVDNALRGARRGSTERQPATI